MLRGKHEARGGMRQWTVLYCVLVTWQRELSDGEGSDTNLLTQELDEKVNKEMVRKR